MEFVEEDIFKLTPLSWEEIATELKELKRHSMISSGSPIISQRHQSFSATSSITTSDSFMVRNNAGTTPNKTSKIRNSIDVLRDKLNHHSKVECKENAPLNYSQEYPALLDAEMTDFILLSNDKKSQYSLTTQVSGKEINDCSLFEEKRTQYSSITESSGNGTPSTPILQLDLKTNSESSCKIIEEIHDPDIDMFEDFDLLTQGSARLPEEATQPLELYIFLKNLANHSCPHFKGKSNFAPEFEFRQTNYLEKELFESSTEEIKENIDQIIISLEDDSN